MGGESFSIERAAAELKGSWLLTLEGGDPESPLWKSLHVFGEQIAKASVGVRFEVRTDALIGVPGLRIRKPMGPAIYYSAVPEGLEWKPFEKLLSDVACGRTIVIQSQKSDVTWNVDVYVASTCAHCVDLVSQAHELAWTNPRVRLTIRDVVYFSDQCRDLKIQSTPAVVVNGVLRWVGRAEPGALESVVRDSGQSWADSLMSMMDSQAMDEACACVMREEAAALALAELLERGELSRNVAVLNILEIATTEGFRPSRELVDRMAKLAENTSAQVRGDGAYALGLLRSQDAIPALQKLLQDENPDVRETAQDALEMIGSADSP